MRAWTSLVAAVALLLLGGTGAAAKKVPTAEADALRERARKAWEVRRDAPQPLVLEGEIEVPREGKDALRGRWLLEVHAPWQWREEIDLGGFEETFVATDAGWWIHRAPDRYLQLVADIQDALDPSARLDLFDDHEVVSARQPGGEDAPVELRIESHGPVAPAWRPLLSPAGRLVRLEGLVNYATYEYEGHVDAGGIAFPAVVRVLHDRHVAAIVRVRARAPDAVDPARLVPPEGVEAVVWELRGRCEKAVLDVAQRTGDFSSPSETLLLGGTGLVRTLLTVEPDGEVSRVAVRWASDAAYVQPVIDHAMGLRFKPPRCDGKVVRLLAGMTFGHGRRR